MHQRYSHCGGYDRRTNHHIDHLQERQKIANPQTAIDRPRIDRQAWTQVRRMRTANLPPAQLSGSCRIKSAATWGSKRKAEERLKHRMSGASA